MKTFKSIVTGFEGECAYNDRVNELLYRLDTRLVGFFRLVKTGWFGIRYKTGKEFHGYIGSDGIVRSTEGIYSSSQFI